MRIPLVDAVFDVQLGIERQADGSIGYNARIESGRPAVITTPFGTVKYDDAILEAGVAADGIDAAGVITGVVVDLDPIVITVESANLRLTRRRDDDRMQVTLQNVVLGPLGTLPLVDLVIEDRPGEARDVRLEAVAAWSNVRARLQIPSYSAEPSGYRDGACVGDLAG